MARKEYDPPIAARIPKGHKELLLRHCEFYEIKMTNLVKKIIAVYYLANKKQNGRE